RLVNASSVGHEPEVDGPELADDLALDAGLLAHLADRGLRLGLAGLDMALRQRPEQAAAPVEPADESTPGVRAAAVEDQSAGAGLVDPLQGLAGSLPRW